MAEYIEREAAISFIKENQCKKCSDIGLCGGCAVLIAIKLFQTIPAADVQPVRYGRWERASKSLMVCTACGNCVVDDRISGMFYCPNCGAKMDKEEE